VRFVVGDIHDPLEPGPFDAIVGRLVLMYVPDPAAVLRRQAAALRPGGIVAPIEFDVGTARTIPETAPREPGAELGAGGIRARRDPAGARSAPQTLLPLIERTGVATAAEVDPDTLERRLGDELSAAQAVFAHPALTCAWAVVER
jgi:SAM-dependent methyltransferase